MYFNVTEHEVFIDTVSNFVSQPNLPELYTLFWIFCNIQEEISIIVG